MNWNTAPAVAAAATSTVATGTTSNVFLAWSVTSDVQSFANGSATNFGWRIADTVLGAPTSPETEFAPREFGTTTSRPRLTVLYSL